MSMLSLRFVPVLLFLTGLAFAQTVLEGTVRDTSGKPLNGVRVSLQREDGATTQASETDTEGRFQFSAVEAGACVIRTSAPGYYDSSYHLTIRPRQPVSAAIELQPTQSVQQTMEVRARYQTVDPEKTGSSQTFTQEDLERLPDPIVESTNSLVSNLMPGASQSHDNFINVRGNEFSLHEFVNGVSFLDNTQPQFSPGVSPQIFETVDLVTGGFTPEYGNRFGGILDITTRSGRTMSGHGDINYRGPTLDNHDLNGDFGGQAGKLGY